MTDSHSRLMGLARLAAVLPRAAELRVARPEQHVSGRWQDMPVEPAAGVPLGTGFRPLQALALGLEPNDVLAELLGYPFAVIRLAAYWDRIEPDPGTFDPSWLDWQVDAAERAGKQIIICTGPIKAFRYPEFFVPAHHLPAPLPEGRLITPETHRSLLEAAIGFMTKIIRRYAERSAVIAWQVEHEVADPLGMEHSWRLSADFAAAEVAAARAADQSWPVLMNGFLPATVPVGRRSGGVPRIKATPLLWPRGWRTPSASTTTPGTRSPAGAAGLSTWTAQPARSDRDGTGTWLDGPLLQAGR